MADKALTDLAQKAVAHATRKGAQQCAVVVNQRRFIQLTQRDGQLEKITEASSSGLSLELYVDGRYSSNSTSDLRWSALESFIDFAVPMTRILSKDPHRGLAEPKLYEGRSEADLAIFDTGYGAVDATKRRGLVERLEAVARDKDKRIISVEAGYYDSLSESVRVHSNGFVGHHRHTQYWMGSSVSVRDPQGRKPSESHWEGARHLKELPSPEELATRATTRALGRIGQTKLDTARMTVVIENRTAGGPLRHLLRAMRGDMIQQNRSFLKDKVGQVIGSKHLTLIDDPLLPGGFGSHHFDSDGIAAIRRPLIEAGKLSTFLINVYYGRKMGVPPTGGGTSNLIIQPGSNSLAAILSGVGEGLYVTGFLGGNSDSTAGDFSHGVLGYRISGGKLAEPVGEMNITGNHNDLWGKLTEVGNDPWKSSTVRTPTMVFEDVAVSGV